MQMIINCLPFLELSRGDWVDEPDESSLDFRGLSPPTSVSCSLRSDMSNDQWKKNIRAIFVDQALA